MSDEVFAFVVGVFVGVFMFIMLLTILRPSEHGEQKAFIEGRQRITAGKCEEWHAPLKPGDSPWWEPCK